MSNKTDTPEVVPEPENKDVNITETIQESPTKIVLSDVPTESVEISQFKAQLAQSLELNDQVITQLEKKEKEISVFKELNDNLKSTILAKDQEISQLKAEMQMLKMSRFNEKKTDVFNKWMSQFNLSPEQTDSVQRMLSKFTSEDELEDVERMLEASSVKKESSPVALTQTSTFLENQPSENSPKYEALSPNEKLEYLHKKIEIINKKN
jgi:lipopolysaccharide biosynthesis regulator YciM